MTDEEKLEGERLEILTMIKEGRITPEEGVRLLEALDKADSDEEKPPGRTGKTPRWLNVEICTKRGSRYKSITPIRIPFSLVRLFFRFIPKDTSLTGSTNFDEALSSLEEGKPLELLAEKDGRAIRITAE
jgi:hypothetical protein